MNYTYLRNPEHLVRELGFAGSDPEARHGARVAGRRQERAFMDALHGRESEELRDLLVVIGGFLDGLLGHAYALCLRLPDNVRDARDVYYREHYEGADVRELVELYRRRGKHVVVAGHSWGGHAAVHAVALRTGAAIHLLITLDPVSRHGLPQKRPVNVRRWINIYVDYARAARLARSNLTARAGGPWQRVSAAHVNVICDPSINHARAETMFRRHALPELAAGLSV